MKLIIFHSYLCEIGGCETVLYNMCEQLKDWYDITVLYSGASKKQLERLDKIVHTEKYIPKFTYECDVMIRNSSWDTKPDNIISSKNVYIQMIHADYEVLLKKGLFKYEKWDKTTKHIGCGEHVAKTFTKVTGYDCSPIKNILEITKPINKIYTFIYAGRLFWPDKVANLERIKKLIDKLEKAKMKYLIYIYTDKVTENPFKNNENVIIRKPRYYDLHDEMAAADYGILFSDAEGLPCFVQECLQYGTPCIVTNNKGSAELIKNGVNGYVVPMSMNFDINKIKYIPEVKDYSNGTTAKTWCDELGYSEYKPNKKLTKESVYIKPIDNDIWIQAVRSYEDSKPPLRVQRGKVFYPMEGNKINKGDKYKVSPERAAYIISSGYAVCI